MTINSISPSFCGIKDNIYAYKNMREISKNIEGSVIDTKKKITGNDGSFLIEGYRSARPSAEFEVSPTSLGGFYEQKIEDNPSYVIKYDAKDGLEMKFNSRKYDDMYYSVTQRHGEEPIVETGYYTADITSEEITEPRRQKTVNNALARIKDALGTFLPTIDTIKK
jgi:hypothetical protein